MERSLSLLEETKTRKPNHNNYTNKGMHKGGDLIPASAWLDVEWGELRKLPKKSIKM